MALPNYVYVGMRSPYAVQVDVSPSDTMPNLSIVSAATISVTKPDGSTASWSATLSNQTATTLKLTHVLATDGTDVATPGRYVLVAQLTTPAGLRISEPTHLYVHRVT